MQKPTVFGVEGSDVIHHLFEFLVGELPKLVDSFDSEVVDIGLVADVGFDLMHQVAGDSFGFLVLDELEKGCLVSSETVVFFDQVQLFSIVRDFIDHFEIQVIDLFEGFFEII